MTVTKVYAGFSQILVVGRIADGTLSVGDEVNAGTEADPVIARVTSIEMAKRKVQEAPAGSEAGVWLSGIGEGVIGPGGKLIGTRTSRSRPDGV
jgi:translation elongation factor EF-Tu-like GTPase